MIWKTPQGEVFWPLKSSSKISRVAKDSQVPISGVWVSSSHSSKSGVATLRVNWWRTWCLVVEGDKYKMIGETKHTWFSNFLSQPHFGQMWGWNSLPKVGTWSPPGLLQLQSSTAEGKTPRLEVIFMSLESSWSVDVKNGLTWAIWTFAAQVMVERRAESQIGNLTPNHQKSGIDSTPVCASGVRHTVGKLLRRATILLQTSS